MEPLNFNTGMECWIYKSIQREILSDLLVAAVTYQLVHPGVKGKVGTAEQRLGMAVGFFNLPVT